MGIPGSVTPATAKQRRKPTRGPVFVQYVTIRIPAFSGMTCRVSERNYRYILKTRLLPPRFQEQVMQKNGPTILIDDKKCTRCLKCIAECPTCSLDHASGTTIQAEPAICIACGHCISVCPFNALAWNEQQQPRPFSISDIPPESSDLSDIFTRTRSIRKYQHTAIDKDILSSIISDAETAPSGENFRRREYIVVNNSDTIREMENLLTDYYSKIARLLSPIVFSILSLYSKPLVKELGFATSVVASIKKRKLENTHTLFRDAPCVIFITGPKKSLLAKDDCIAAQNYMRLSATTHGLGSCIIGFAQESKGVLEKFLNIEKDRRIYAATIFGYQKNEFLKKITYENPKIKWM
jgi:ferredoxin